MLRGMQLPYTRGHHGRPATAISSTALRQLSPESTQPTRRHWIVSQHMHTQHERPRALRQASQSLYSSAAARAPHPLATLLTLHPITSLVHGAGGLHAACRPEGGIMACFHMEWQSSQYAWDLVTLPRGLQQALFPDQSQPQMLTEV
jgi:hypothetical protein